MREPSRFLCLANSYAINRISLFALIFSIGILVDDAIVHWISVA